MVFYLQPTLSQFSMVQSHEAMGVSLRQALWGCKQGTRYHFFFRKAYRSESLEPSKRDFLRTRQSLHQSTRSPIKEQAHPYTLQHQSQIVWCFLDHHEEYWHISSQHGLHSWSASTQAQILATSRSFSKYYRLKSLQTSRSNSTETLVACTP
jgi:hypothetical protein